MDMAGRGPGVDPQTGMRCDPPVSLDIFAVEPPAAKSPTWTAPILETALVRA